MSMTQNLGNATVTFDNNSDSIDTLPTDQNMPSHSEIQIVDTIFKQNGTVQKFLSGTKDVLVLGFIFLIFCLPQFDDLVKRLVPSTEKSPYIFMGFKTLIFMFVYFIVKNIYLVRKK